MHVDLLIPFVRIKKQPPSQDKQYGRHLNSPISVLEMCIPFRLSDPGASQRAAESAAGTTTCLRQPSTSSQCNEIAFPIARFRSFWRIAQARRPAPRHGPLKSHSHCTEYGMLCQNFQSRSMFPDRWYASGAVSRSLGRTRMEHFFFQILQFGHKGLLVCCQVPITWIPPQSS